MLHLLNAQYIHQHLHLLHYKSRYDSLTLTVIGGRYFFRHNQTTMEIIVTSIYIAPLKSEALPNRVSDLNDKEGGFQALES